MLDYRYAIKGDGVTLLNYWYVVRGSVKYFKYVITVDDNKKYRMSMYCVTSSLLYNSALTYEGNRHVQACNVSQLDLVTVNISSVTVDKQYIKQSLK